jgi:hypothetical protein
MVLRFSRWLYLLYLRLWRFKLLFQANRGVGSCEVDGVIEIAGLAIELLTSKETERRSIRAGFAILEYSNEGDRCRDDVEDKRIVPTSDRGTWRFLCLKR